MASISPTSFGCCGSCSRGEAHPRLATRVSPSRPALTTARCASHEAPLSITMTGRMAQIKHDELLAPQDAREPPDQVFAQALVMIEPPECWPGEDDGARPGLTEAPKLADRRRVVRRGPPVPAPSLEKRGRMAVGDGKATQPVVINEDETGTWRHDLDDFLSR